MMSQVELEIPIYFNFLAFKYSPVKVPKIVSFTDRE